MIKTATLKINKINGRVIERYESIAQAARENNLPTYYVFDHVNKNQVGKSWFIFRRESDWSGFEKFGRKNYPVIIEDTIKSTYKAYSCTEVAANKLIVSISSIYNAVNENRLLLNRYKIYRVKSTEDVPQDIRRVLKIEIEDNCSKAEKDK